MRIAAIVGAFLLGFVVAFAMRETLARGDSEPSAAVWVTEGQETRVQLANVTLPDCLGGVSGTRWSPPMFLLPWLDDHEGPLPWTGNTGTTHLASTGIVVDGKEVLAHVHVLWNTTTDESGQVAPDLSAGRIVVHLMAAGTDHTPPCSVEVAFVRRVPTEALTAAAASKE
ncbi:MAG: hypothetical protein WEE64_06845 [Dehalococcoidia bacterium]